MDKKSQDISFEDAIKNLEEIVTKLEKGDLTLEESLNEFKTGIDIYKYCDEILNDAEGKVKLILEDDEGKIISRNIDEI